MSRRRTGHSQLRWITQMDKGTDTESLRHEQSPNPIGLGNKHSYRREYAVEFTQVFGSLFFTHPSTFKSIACQPIKIFPGDGKRLNKGAIVVVHVPAEIGRVI